MGENESNQVVVQLIDDYYLKIDDHQCYELMLDKHTTSLNKKTGVMTPVYKTVGYYSSPRMAIHSLVRELSFAEAKKENRTLSLKEYVDIICAVDDRVEAMVDKLGL